MDFGFDKAWNPSAVGSSVAAAVAVAARRSAVASAFRDGPRRLGWTLIDGPTIPHGTRRSRTFVLGVVLWSQYDLTALEKLAGVAWIRNKGIPVEVFDIDAFPTFDDLALVVPGVLPFSRTPVLTEYQDGRVVESWVGADVSKWCVAHAERDPREGTTGVRIEPTGTVPYDILMRD